MTRCSIREESPVDNGKGRLLGGDLGAQLLTTGRTTFPAQLTLESR
jgi:hypothetical protein